MNSTRHFSKGIQLFISESLDISLPGNCEGRWLCLWTANTVSTVNRFEMGRAVFTSEDFQQYDSVAANFLHSFFHGDEEVHE
jgi:hypothetical protein